MNLIEALRNGEAREQAEQKFSDADRAVEFMVHFHWPDGKVRCLTCGSQDVTWLPTRQLFQCKKRHPRYQFSVKLTTIFEDSAIPLGKWLMIAWLFANGYEKSTYDIARSFGITQKSAWLMVRRIQSEMSRICNGNDTLQSPDEGIHEFTTSHHHLPN